MPAPSALRALPYLCPAYSAVSRSFGLARLRQIPARDGSASLFTGRYGFLAPVSAPYAWV
ncbi:MAG TPA: hypothetical protein VKQ36_00680 [Ktedonobacterales bacterium]|nr:hypothetical protein [Ktedonobacterales bacterium]